MSFFLMCCHRKKDRFYKEKIEIKKVNVGTEMVYKYLKVFD